MVMEDDVIEELKKIIDPHTEISVYDMGLIQNLNIKDNNISLTFIPSSPYCPLGVQLALEIKNRMKEIKGVGAVDIKVQGYAQEEELNRMLKEK